jgi:hypothetical protein
VRRREKRESGRDVFAKTPLPEPLPQKLLYVFQLTDSTVIAFPFNMPLAIQIP